MHPHDFTAPLFTEAIAISFVFPQVQAKRQKTRGPRLGANSKAVKRPNVRPV
jgi:hypothetical protein